METMKNCTMKWMISDWEITLDKNGDFEATKGGELIRANLNSFVSTETENQKTQESG